MQLQELVIPLRLDKEGFDTNISGVSKSVGGLSGLLSALGGPVALIATGGIAAVGAGLVGLTAILNDSIQGAMQAEEIQSQLSAVLKSTGGVAGMTADSVNELASSLSQVTRYEDDAIVSGESLLLTFTNIGQDVFPQTTEVMLDMSTAMGQDLKTSAIQLGKALNDPTEGMTALTRVGVTFTEEQKKLIKTLQESGDMAGAQTIILQELQREFGGSARAAGETFAGKLDILKNTIGNVKDSIGSAFLPVLKDMADRLLSFVQSDQFQQWVETASQWLREELPKAIQATVNFWNNDLRPAVERLIPVVRDDVIPALRDIAHILGEVLPPAIQFFGGVFVWAVDVVRVGIQIFNDLRNAIMNVVNLISNAINQIYAFANSLGSLQLPPWLTPGSPTPFELGLRGINDAFRELNRGSLPEFSGNINMNSVGNGLMSSQAVFVYQPFISTADEYEAERILKPYIVSTMRSEESRKR